ncbi:branched-chain amino acid ABC transporter ATP-binding protein/permease [Bradyrhizobium sp. 170]|uniref:branched-chain amino acid ABC transporter ATP-binding protein/permease n=1 Tax=Bradyrhizobium sp. 170 TaxID=2782641 RepID=UPI001FFFB3C6|nr:branched-chain amino acid ABC transporter ATP-binding protein/permease [Bradyrhizobium sp. 170]UPK06184.1 ATP-binding cassette domain-containing protein [Bradyrhizobium sp. 170]
MTSTAEKYRPLLSATLGVIALPFGLYLLGLSLNTGTMVVALAIAAMGLNLCIGYTGLVSFGHGAWFGIGAYAAGLIQRNWFNNDIFLPLLLAAVVVAIISTFVGFVILRRRGVYFSLLTLALSALAYTIAFRWTAVTGGEDGLGGLKRGSIGAFSLDNALNYYIVVSVLCLGVLYLLLRLVRSPFGHVLMAIRENQLRATFQGYPVERYKLGVFVISAVVTGFAGGLIGFQNYLVSAEAVSVPFSGELLAIVVIGGMRSMLGPAIGALFFILFRELFSIWTPNWLLWFGLVFVAFVLYSPGGLVGIWATLSKRWWPPPEESAAMSRRKIYEGLPLPAFLLPKGLDGIVLDVRGVSKTFGGIRAVTDASLQVGAGEIHALIGPNGAGKTTLFNLVSGLYPTDGGTITLNGREIQGVPSEAICHQGLARSFQITNLFKGLSIYENLRLSLQAQNAGRFNLWRDIDDYKNIHAETAELIKFLGLEGIEAIEGGELSYGGQRLVDLGIALGSKPQVLLLDEPLAGLAAAERERVSNLVKNIAANIPVLIVEHDIDRVLGFSRTVTVMNQGEVLMTGTPEAVRADRRVQEIYTGTGVPEVEHLGSDYAKASAAPVLRFERVNTFYGKSHILHDATLDVREGEIVALLGRNGAGKSTLLKTLAGLVPLSSGAIEYAGSDISRLPAPDIARAGIGYVPQGRGLFAGMTVRENLSLGRLARKTDGSNGVVWDEAQILDYFPRLRERMDVAADYLSGGEQQMVAVARAMSGNVKLLLLDEPFEGLAPAVILDLFKVFDRLRQHISIVIVEHNLDLVLALADRVFALERGAVFHEGPAQPLLTDLEYRKKILWL